MQDPKPDPRTDAVWRFVALIESIVSTVDTPSTKLDRVYGSLVALHTELDQIGPATDPGDPGPVRSDRITGYGGSANV